jgi:hypothetical protein
VIAELGPTLLGAGFAHVCDLGAAIVAGPPGSS